MYIILMMTMTNFDVLWRPTTDDEGDGLQMTDYDIKTDYNGWCWRWANIYLFWQIITDYDRLQWFMTDDD